MKMFYNLGASFGKFEKRILLMINGYTFKESNSVLFSLFASLLYGDQLLKEPLQS